MFNDNREYKILYEVGNQSCKLIFLIKVFCVNEFDIGCFEQCY